MGFAPSRALCTASSASASALIELRRVEEAWAQPVESAAVITVDKSATEVRASANTPRELATPRSIPIVRIEPAAEYPADLAFLQITPARIARCCGVQ